MTGTATTKIGGAHPKTLWKTDTPHAGSDSAWAATLGHFPGPFPWALPTPLALMGTMQSRSPFRRCVSRSPLLRCVSRSLFDGECPARLFDGELDASEIQITIAPQPTFDLGFCKAPSYPSNSPNRLAHGHTQKATHVLRPPTETAKAWRDKYQPQQHRAPWL